MNRRQFVAGVGGLTVGGSAVMGSSAFSTVRAERNVSLNVESDQNAYLVFDGVSNNFARDDDLIGFVFDDEVTPSDGGTFDETGDGVSPNSVYEFTGLVQIQNQGTESVVVFGEYTGTELVSLELIANGRRSPLIQSNPSETIDAPGDFITAGLRMEIGDIPPQEIETDLTIIGVSEDSERYPDVFPTDEN